MSVRLRRMMAYKLSGSRELPLREAYPFGEAHGFGPEVRRINDVKMLVIHCYASFSR